MRTLINRTLLTSASALSILGLVLTLPQAASAQEMTEEMKMETTEAIEMEDGRVGQTVEMDDSDINTEADAGMDSDDIDTDYDNDDDDNDIEAETYSAPTYSNSPRALW